MKVDIKELPIPNQDNTYYYAVEKSLYGGFVIYIELESALKKSGTLDDPNTSAYWKQMPLLNSNPN